MSVHMSVQRLGYVGPGLKTGLSKCVSINLEIVRIEIVNNKKMYICLIEKSPFQKIPI